VAALLHDDWDRISRVHPPSCVCTEPRVTSRDRLGNRKLGVGFLHLLCAARDVYEECHCARAQMT
jgi:hypothetical protein